MVLVNSDLEKRKYFRFSRIINTGKVKICSLRRNFRIFEEEWSVALQEGWEVFVFPNWFCSSVDTKQMLNSFKALGFLKYIDQVHVFTNTKEEETAFREVGFNAILLPHNAFLDENLFSISDETPRYKALLVTRNGKYKFPWLAKKVDGLAVACNYSLAKEEKDFYDTRELKNNALFYEENMEIKKVAQLINQSICTLHLSPIEGSCRASCESLLCGVPAVSIRSKGRDYWYDSDNSIICEPSEKNVAEAVEEMVQRHHANKINKLSIREKYIQHANFYRRKYYEYIEAIFKKHGEGIFPESLMSTKDFYSHIFSYCFRETVIDTLREG